MRGKNGFVFFEGKWENDQPNGYGIMKFPHSGDRHEGNYRQESIEESFSGLMEINTADILNKVWYFLLVMKCLHELFRCDAWLWEV